MDLRTNMVLKKLAMHRLLKKLLLLSSYAMLLLCFAIFAFYIFNNPQKRYKIVSDYKEGKKNIKSEKVMINPTINFKYDDNQVFKIKAKKASHTDRSGITMFDVDAVGDIGTIKAGKVVMSDNGNRITFSVNPILVIKNKK